MDVKRPRQYSAAQRHGTDDLDVHDLCCGIQRQITHIRQPDGLRIGSPVDNKRAGCSHCTSCGIQRFVKGQGRRAEIGNVISLDRQGTHVRLCGDPFARRTCGVGFGRIDHCDVYITQRHERRSGSAACQQLGRDICTANDQLIDDNGAAIRQDHSLVAQVLDKQIAADFQYTVKCGNRAATQTGFAVKQQDIIVRIRCCDAGFNRLAPTVVCNG